MFISGSRGLPPKGPAPKPARPVYTPPPSVPIRQVVNPVAPYHAPPAPSHFLGAVGHAISGAAPAVHNAVQQATTPHQAGVGPHNAFTATPQYKQAVAQVFHAQPPAAKAAIIRGISRANAFNTPEYQAIRPQWDHMSLPERNAISSLIPKDLPKFIAPKPGPDIFGDLAHLLSPKSVLGAEGPVGTGSAQGNVLFGGPQQGEKTLQDIGKGLSSLINKIPTGVGMPTEQRGILKQQGLVPGELGKGILKDAVNLPAEAGPSVAIPVGQALSGHWKQALHSVTDPYVQALHDPKKAIAEHPLNTFLMFSGPAHLGARALDTGASLAVKHELPNVQAESVHLTGNLTHERPDFSKSPITRASQKSLEKQLYKRNRHGKLVPRSDAVRARLIKLETSRLVGQNERVRVARREQQVNAHAETVLQPKAARALHSVRTAAKYNPEPALIPGANILARIADATIRRPATLARDLKTHLDQVAANRPNLAGRPKLLAEHDAYVKELQAAQNNKAFLKNPEPAFKAAAQYAKDYAPIEKAAHAFGHFRDMTASALERRALAHVVLTHMPGAHMSADHGLMVGNRPLTTLEMRQFAARETGGRPIGFTSDEPRAGDRAFYVNGQRRPPTAAKGDTYFNYTHGLTAPGHESLLEQRVRMQGISDAHTSMNRLADQLLLQNERTGKVKAWGSYRAAKTDAPEGYQPIRLAQPFHPPDSVQKALDTGKVNMATLEEEAAHRQLDINSRLQPSSEPGTYGLIDQHAATQLRAHENLISPNTFYRGLRGLTGQFRRVALATSFRHLPGVAQEQAIRAAAEGIGPISLLAGHAALRRAQRIDPKLGEQRRIEMTGGAASGQALALQTRQVAHHFAGTMLEGPLTAFEKLTAAPGARQVTNAWHAWVKLTLGGTKRILEQNAQVSAIGKQVIADFGGRHGVLAAAMGQWGKMIDQAGHGILDENTARRLGSYVRRVYGRWTDLTPGEQAALMFSPFGMWWTNSVAWLARMPVDHPMGAAFMAALNTGTEQQRKQLGLDMFAPNHLPLYQQGGIPIGGKLWGANYYSAFGIANDPGETAQSLIAPWQSELLKAFAGQDWKGTTITSPANPKGRNKPPAADVGVVILNSLLSSFVPLYTKAQTIVQGGASSYDTSTAFAPQTKKANPGPVEGLKKATMPLRLSTPAGASSTTSSTSKSTGWGGRQPSSSSGSSSGGWGGSSKATGGWGG